MEDFFCQHLLYFSMLIRFIFSIDVYQNYFQFMLIIFFVDWSEYFFSI